MINFCLFESVFFDEFVDDVVSGLFCDVDLFGDFVECEIWILC